VSFTYFFLSALFCLASPGATAGEKVNTNPVAIDASFQRETVAPNSPNDIVIHLHIAPKHHVYKDTLKVRAVEPQTATINDLSISPAHKFLDKFSGVEREGIEKEATIKTQILFAQAPPPGKQNFKLSLTYQACSESYCLFPKTIELDLAGRVEAAPSLQQEVKPAESAAISPQSESYFAKQLARGTFWAFLAAFIGGFLTSLTPCVFPMIPITISIIGARAAHSRKTKAFSLSLAYVLGIALTYSTLGVIAALTGAFFGQALSSPIVVALIAATFVAMALSMFGLYDIQAPAFIRNSIGAKSTGAGLPGAFLAGLFSGIVASPCIGPVLVGILAYVAQTRDAVFGFSLLFTFALGMGLLFLALGTFSGLVQKLPRSGAWMKSIKSAFGIVFIGMAFYYAAPLLSAQFRQITSQAPINLSWQKFSDELLAQARLANRPVIIDFSADWCVACKELEKYTYVDPRVIGKGKNFVLLKVDTTTLNEATKELQSRYKVVGLPTVLFIDSRGKLLTPLTITGFVKPDVFLKAMDEAAR